MRGNSMPDKKNKTAAKKKASMPVEKKMALVQYIRQENLDNRMRVRQRERILYGAGSPLPLWDKGKYNLDMAKEQEQALDPYEHSYGREPGYTGTFKYRMIIAILLFVGFLVFDTNGNKIGEYSTNDIHEMIVADAFHLYDGEESEEYEKISFIGRNSDAGGETGALYRQ